MTAQALQSPEDFPRAFASFWGARDAEGLSALLVEDADMLTLSGAVCEGRKEIASALSGEFAGSFARSRLVTGKARLRPIGPGAGVLHQRFVLSGLVDHEGRDMGRIGALMTAVLIATQEGWRAVSLTFAATG